MWGENLVASIQDVIRTNPFLSYIAYPQGTSDTRRRAEPEAEKKEELLLSREALEIVPMEEEEADERFHDGEAERGKSDEERLEEIDRHVTELLTLLLMNQEYAVIVLENFNRTRDLFLQNQRPDAEASESRPSLKVLKHLSFEERLPAQFRQAFLNLFLEYQALSRYTSR
ncbi:MAG: hypothetical protein RDV48_05515 [Candidatus Eremiobacteraeota bacterium]|nr:hypothetical protein [Candidatus Eremiobacteraeota bacterium]